MIYLKWIILNVHSVRRKYCIYFTLKCRPIPLKYIIFVISTLHKSTLKCTFFTREGLLHSSFSLLQPPKFQARRISNEPNVTLTKGRLNSDVVRRTYHVCWVITCTRSPSLLILCVVLSECQFWVSGPGGEKSEETLHIQQG